MHLFNRCKVNRESGDVKNILSFLSSPFVSRVSRDKRFITENYTSDNIPLYIQHNHLYSVVTTGHRYLVLCRCVDENKIAFHFMEVLQNYRFWSELHFTSLMDSGIFLSSTINHHEIRIYFLVQQNSAMRVVNVVALNFLSGVILPGSGRIRPSRSWFRSRSPSRRWRWPGRWRTRSWRRWCTSAPTATWSSWRWHQQ